MKCNTRIRKFCFKMLIFLWWMRIRGFGFAILRVYSLSILMRIREFGLSYSPAGSLPNIVLYKHCWSNLSYMLQTKREMKKKRRNGGRRRREMMNIAFVFYTQQKKLHSFIDIEIQQKGKITIKVRRPIWLSQRLQKNIVHGYHILPLFPKLVHRYQLRPACLIKA